MPAVTILNDPLATGGTFPQDVNDTGEIVGYYIDSQGSHGFTYTNGTFSTTAPNVLTAEGINNAGQVVGSTISDPTHPSDINNAGQVVGSFPAPNNTTQSFISSGGNATQLSFPGGISTFARGINDQSQIVGYWTGTDSAFPGITISHGFFYENGSWSTLDASAGVGGTFADGINNSDFIVGYYIDNQGTSHGFTFNKPTATFNSVEMQGATNTYLYGINNLGEMVGTFVDGNGTTYGFSVSASPDIKVFDTTRNQGFLPITDQYAGPVAGLQQEYIYPGHDAVNIITTSDDWFLKGGPLDDAIQAHGGYNVLDGSTGSNFLTGGSGTNTFFVDDRGPPADIWSTVNGFHAGDDATVFFDISWKTDFSDIQWVDNQGAAGFTGLTLHVTTLNQPTASLTLPGYNTADLSNGRLSVAFGTEPDNTPFMHVIAIG